MKKFGFVDLGWFIGFVKLGLGAGKILSIEYTKD